MAYSKFESNWENDEAGGTPITEAALDHIEQGIFDAAADADDAQARAAALEALVPTAPVLKSVVDAAGDLIVGSAADTVTRIAKGSDGTWLRVTGGALVYSTIGLADIPMTGASEGDVLTAVSGVASWESGGSGVFVEVDYVEFTSNVDVSGGSGASPVTLVSGTSVSYAGTPVLVEFYASFVSGTGNGDCGIDLWEGTSTRIGRISYTGADMVAGGSYTIGVVARRFTPSAGSHTYTVRGWKSAGTTAVVNAGNGSSGNVMPGFIRISQLTS